MRASLAALALAVATRRAPSHARRLPAAAAAAWTCSSSEAARKEGARRDRLTWSISFSSTFSTTSTSPLDAALAEAWAAAAASIDGDDDEDEDSELDRAISILETELVSRKEGDTSSPPSALSAAAFEAVALFRLWRCSSSSGSGSNSSTGMYDARALALAERAAARAVSIAEAAESDDGNSEAAAAAVRRLCALRHGAALAALGRADDAARALEAFERVPSSPSASSEMITSLHVAEAKFYRELVSPSSCASSPSRSLAAALSSLVELDRSSSPFASRVHASALLALRGSLEALLSEGKLSEARRLAEAEAEAHESRAAAEAAAGEEPRAEGAKSMATKATSSSSFRRRPGSSPPPPPFSPSAEAAAHAKYRLATLAYSAGDADALALARAALDASFALWGRGDDRSWLRRHRLAAAALADEVLGPRASDSPAGSPVEETAAALPPLSPSPVSPRPPAPPAPPAPPEPLVEEDGIEAEASRALRRFQERLGGDSGLAGEARLVSAAARLLRLREEGRRRRRQEEEEADDSSSPHSPLAAFEAVLSPKREADAAAEAQRGFREMLRGCSGGKEHPLVKRAAQVMEKLQREKT